MNNLLNQLADIIAEDYLFPDKAQELARAARQLEMPSGDGQSIAALLTKALIDLSGDEHFLLEYAPDELANKPDHEAIMKARTEQARARNYGFAAVQWLPGNIGYWKLNELLPIFINGNRVQASLTLLADTKHIILDLRDCEGGAPDAVQFIASVFLEGELPLSGIQSHKHGNQLYTTLQEMDAPRLLEMPLTLLIGERTFSAAEALAYDLQAHNRATIIGQTSRGGAHLSDFFSVDDTWRFRVPVARALNPLTGSNWEGTGVIPDIEAADALTTAIKRAT